MSFFNKMFVNKHVCVQFFTYPQYNGIYYISVLENSIMSNGADPARKKAQVLQDSGTLNPMPTRSRTSCSGSTPSSIAPIWSRSNTRCCVCVEKRGTIRLPGRALDFGFSRRHFYVIQQQFAERGFQSLIPEKRGPRGAHKLDQAVMAFVHQTLDDDPSLKAPALSRLIQLAVSSQGASAAASSARWRVKKNPEPHQ